MKIKHTLAALNVALWMMAGTAVAADEQEDPWQFGVTVPLWAAGINGDATLRGNTADVDISFHELEQHLDASFALGLEARKEKFGFYTAVGYMKFSADGTAKGASAHNVLKFLIADAGGFYRLVKTGGERPFILEALAGIRYWSTENDLKLKGPGGNVLLNDSTSNDLLDPIIGLRGSQFLAPKLHLDFSGDIGGFDISDHTSDLDWSATGLLTYDVTRWFSLSAGYKALGLDVSRGSGTKEEGVNITMHGALIAAKFTF